MQVWTGKTETGKPNRESQQGAGFLKMIDRIFAAPKGCELEQGIQFAIDNRLDYELPTFYYVENLDNKDAEIARYNSLLTGFRGILSMHGPIFDTNVVSLDPEILRVSKRRYLQAIDVAKEMDVRYLVFHSQWTPIYPAANATKMWLAKVTDFWEQLIAEHLEGSNLTILIENFLDPTPDTMLTLLSRVSSPHLRACLDTGHVNIFSELSPIDWIRELGSYVTYIHAHNNGGELDSHDAFDKGLLDMHSFLNHLALLPQKAHLAIETSTAKGLTSSYEMLKPYIKLQNEQFASKSFLI
jgi:sugar phosphate isomerase/epimerase